MKSHPSRRLSPALLLTLSLVGTLLVSTRPASAALIPTETNKQLAGPRRDLARQLTERATKKAAISRTLDQALDALADAQKSKVRKANSAASAKSLTTGTKRGSDNTSSDLTSEFSGETEDVPELPELSGVATDRKKTSQLSKGTTSDMLAGGTKSVGTGTTKPVSDAPTGTITGTTATSDLHGVPELSAQGSVSALSLLLGLGLVLGGRRRTQAGEGAR